MLYDRDTIKRELTRDESEEKYPYKDTEGIWSVGIGQNMEANPLPASMVVEIIIRAGGLTYEEIQTLLDAQISSAEFDLDKLYPEWRTLDVVRQRVLVNMMFNLGYTSFSRFPKFWAAVRAKDWAEAKVQGHDSKWSRQVGVRAERLMNMLEAGE